MDVYCLIEDHFCFLHSYGYRIKSSNSDFCFTYVCENNQIEIDYSDYSYELTCRFIDNTGERYFTLQEALEYNDVNCYKGEYQLSQKCEIKQGISYISKAVKAVFSIMDLSESVQFDSIFEYAIRKRERELKEYYLNCELKKADIFWKNYQYEDATNIYIKHINNLSQVQKKRIDLFKRKTKN